MTLRILPRVDPRLVVIELPDVQLSMQDLANEVMNWEDEPPNLAFPRIIKPSGKQDLGGGVLVGITNELRNSRIAFDPRTVSVSDGTITTTNAAGITLIDNAATFETDGVEPGATVVNFTDQSVGSVLTVDSQIQLTLLKPLDDGTDNQFESGDVYKVWNVIQCEATGGNLLAKNTGGSLISPVLPTFGTQIIRTSSSSATLAELDAIQFASYQNAAWVDTASSNAGTDYPVGTREYPVNNLVDAVAISEDRGFQALGFLGNVTISGSLNIDNYKLIGQSTAITSLVIEASVSCNNITAECCTITGTVGGDINFKNCTIGDLTLGGGNLCECALNGTITPLSGTTIVLTTCHQAGATYPAIDMVNAGVVVSVVRYSGDLIAKNSAVAFNMGIVGFDVGNLNIDASVSAGVFVVSGIGGVTVNGTPSYLNTNSLINSELITDAVWDEAAADHVAAGSMGALQGVAGTTVRYGASMSDDLTNAEFGVWVEDNDGRRTDITSMSAVVKDVEGNQIVDLGTNSSPTADGVFRYTTGSSNLTSHTSYLLHVQATVDGSTRHGNIGFARVA